MRCHWPWSLPGLKGFVLYPWGQGSDGVGLLHGWEDGYDMFTATGNMDTRPPSEGSPPRLGETISATAQLPG